MEKLKDQKRSIVYNMFLIFSHAGNDMSFIEQIKKNLSTNGFPTKKVSFGLEALYEIADSKGENLNDILELLSDEGIMHIKRDEKIIFSKNDNDQSSRNLEEQDVFQQAQKAMAEMSQEELQQIKDMAENMTEDEKASMMEQAKKMGLY
jgi:hypothetical protein